VEEALVGSALLEEGLLGSDGNKVLGGNGGAVQGEEVDGSGRGGLVGKRLGKLNVDDTGSTGTPSVAQLRLLLTVQTGELRSAGDGGEERNSLDPLFVGAVAHAEASTVAASGVDHPILNTGAGGSGARLHDLEVVLLGQVGDGELLNLAGGGIGGVGDTRCS